MNLPCYFQVIWRQKYELHTKSIPKLGKILVTRSVTNILLLITLRGAVGKKPQNLLRQNWNKKLQGSEET